jgi:hypothetical protein
MQKPVWAGVIYYNDGPEMLEICLKAVLACNIKIVAVDGAFKEFPHENHRSTDGCREIAKSLSTVHIEALPDRPWNDQAEKRNQYFQAIPINDYCFVLDADEVLRPFDATKIHFNKNIYRVMMHSDSAKKKEFSTIRVYRIYEDLRYLYQHCRLYRTTLHDPQRDMESGCVVSAHGPNNMIHPLLIDERGDRVFFDHFNHLRPEDRIKMKDEYYNKRQEASMGYVR